MNEGRSTSTAAMSDSDVQAIVEVGILVKPKYVGRNYSNPEVISQIMGVPLWPLI